MRYSLSIIIKEESGKPLSEQKDIFREFTVGELEKLCTRLLKSADWLIERAADPSLLLDDLNKQADSDKLSNTLNF